MRAPQKFTVVVSCALWCWVLGRGHGTGVQGAPRPSPVAPDCWGARFWGPGLCSAPPPAWRRAAGGRVAAGKQVGGVAAAGQGEPPAPLTRAAALGLLPRPNSRWVCAPEAAGQGAAPVPTPQGCFLPLLAGLAVPPWLGGQLCSCWGWEQAKSRSISQQSLAAEPCSPSPCRAAELPLAASRGSGAPRGPGCCVPCAGWGLPALGERRPQLFYIPSASVSCARSNHLLQ